MVAPKKKHRSDDSDRLRQELEMYEGVTAKAVYEAAVAENCDCKLCRVYMKVNLAIALIGVAARRALRGQPEMLEDIGDALADLSDKYPKEGSDEAG